MLERGRRREMPALDSTVETRMDGQAALRDAYLRMREALHLVAVVYTTIVRQNRRLEEAKRRRLQARRTA